MQKINWTLIALFIRIALIYKILLVLSDLTLTLFPLQDLLSVLYCMLLQNAKFSRNAYKVTRAEAPLLFIYNKIFLGLNTLGQTRVSTDNTVQLFFFFFCQLSQLRIFEVLLMNMKTSSGAVKERRIHKMHICICQMFWQQLAETKKQKINLQTALYSKILWLLI